MGIISLTNSQGTLLEQSNFGTDVNTFGYDSNADIRIEEYKNDGEINDLEVADARVQLEKVINKHLIGSGGPLDLGGWGGKEEIYLQAWRLKGSAAEETPDGFSMPVTVHLEETYQTPGIIFHGLETVTRDVPMTIRWEGGKVRLYQCEPPAYGPVKPAPAPPPVAPPPPVETSPDPVPPLVASLSVYLRDSFLSISSFLIALVV